MMNPAEFANIAAAEQRLWWYRGMRRILFDVLDPWLRGRQVRRVLEAGCGTGYFARVLAKERGWTVYPSDIAWKGLSIGRGMGVERLSQADVRALPFRSGAFDIVSAVDVLEHFAPGEESRPLSELARVLSPGGLLVLRTPALEALRSRHSEFVLERQRFTRGRLLGAIRECGIRVRRCTYASFLLLPAALLKFRVWEPLLGKPPASGVKPVAGWLDSLLYSCLWAESAWLGRGLNFPAGQTLIVIGEKCA
jgi:SAM-dependent methyltransferase